MSSGMPWQSQAESGGPARGYSDRTPPQDNDAPTVSQILGAQHLRVEPAKEVANREDANDAGAANQILKQRLTGK